MTTEEELRAFGYPKRLTMTADEARWLGRMIYGLLFRRPSEAVENQILTTLDDWRLWRQNPTPPAYLDARNVVGWLWVRRFTKRAHLSLSQNRLDKVLDLASRELALEALQQDNPVAPAFEMVYTVIRTMPTVDVIRASAQRVYDTGLSAVALDHHYVAASTWLYDIR